MQATGAAETDDVGHADLGAFHLTAAGFPAQVRGYLIDVGDAGCPKRMTFGQEAAGNVDGHPSTQGGFAFVDQPSGFTVASLAITVSNFLDDAGKNRISVFGNANVRIVRGLSLSFFGTVARVRYQVFLPRRGASDEEVLLRQRDLQTDFNYSLNINLRFTFGSIFNNIVNPRFDGGGGQVFFFD